MTSQKRNDIHSLIDTLKEALDAIGTEIDKDSAGTGDTGQRNDGADADYDETIDQMLALLCKFSAFDISPEDFEVVGIHELGSGDLRVSLAFRKDAPDRKDGVAISFNEIADVYIKESLTESMKLFDDAIAGLELFSFNKKEGCNTTNPAVKSGKTTKSGKAGSDTGDSVYRDGNLNAKVLKKLIIDGSSFIVPEKRFYVAFSGKDSKNSAWVYDFKFLDKSKKNSQRAKFRVYMKNDSIDKIVKRFDAMVSRLCNAKFDKRS